jgi:hypothetical protein
MNLVVTTAMAAGLLTATALSAAFAGQPALAETITITGISTPLALGAGQILTIPSVSVVDGNIDEAKVRQLFSGDLAATAPSLAGLDAAKIVIPLMTISRADESFPVSVTHNVVLADVADGVAHSASIDGVQVTRAKGESVALGKVEATDINIAAMLGLYGLVGVEDPTRLSEIFSSLSIAGLDVDAAEAKCTIGPLKLEGVEARPLAKDTMAAFEAMSDEGDESKPEPEEMVALAKAYADLFTSYSVGPLTFGGLDCKITDETDQPVTVAVGGITQAEAAPGHMPEVHYNGISVAHPEGSGSLGSFVLKAIDLSGPLSAIAEQGEDLTYEWITQNARKLIPAADGLALSDLAMDVPDPAGGAMRDKVALGAFDLTLGHYVNGIPAALSTALTRLHVELAATPSNAQLIAMGYGTIDADAGIAVHWDEDAQTLVVEEVSVDWDKAARVHVSATFGNASAALFSEEPETAMQSAQALTLKALRIGLTDEGLLGKGFAMAAEEQKIEPNALRMAMAATAQGSIIVGLAGSADSIPVSQAVMAFINGSAPHLTITATALDPKGLTLADLMATQTDPTALLAKVKLTASNEEDAGAPPPAGEPSAAGQDAAPPPAAAPAEAPPTAAPAEAAGSTMGKAE